MGRGLFITFEGIDGCGKSTQLNMLKYYLENQGEKLMIVREPGGTDIGEKIREVLLSKKSMGMCSITELFLFEAARAQITEEKIKPALEEGTIVICDRFFDSTFAYQGYARGLGEDMVRSLNNIATAGLAPDITFFLDITVEEALKRRTSRGEAEDRMEAQGLKFQQDVRDGYIAASEKESRIVRIDASRTPEEIFSDIKAKIEEKL